MNSRNIADSRKTRAIAKHKRSRNMAIVLVVVFALTYIHALWTWINYSK